MRIVVSHLTFAGPVPDHVAASFAEAADAVLAAGGHWAHLVRVDVVHAMLVLAFPDEATERRVSQDIGGPWMREHVLPHLAEPPRRTAGVVAS